MKRTLTLKSETLLDLTSEELTAVNGGNAFDKTIVATVCAPLITEIRCALSLTQCLNC